MHEGLRIVNIELKEQKTAIFHRSVIDYGLAAANVYLS